MSRQIGAHGTAAIMRRKSLGRDTHTDTDTRARRRVGGTIHNTPGDSLDWDYRHPEPDDGAGVQTSQQATHFQKLLTNSDGLIS